MINFKIDLDRDLVNGRTLEGIKKDLLNALDMEYATWEQQAKVKREKELKEKKLKDLREKLSAAMVDYYLCELDYPSVDRAKLIEVVNEIIDSTKCTLKTLKSPAVATAKTADKLEPKTADQIIMDFLTMANL